MGLAAVLSRPVRTDGNVDINITKFGGMGDIYPIRPLGQLGHWLAAAIAQGSMGYFTGTETL